MKRRGSIKQPILFIVALLIFGSTAVNSPAMAEPGQAAAPSFHPTGNLTLYPDTPLPTYTTIKPLESIYRRTPNAAVVGGSTLDQRVTHDQLVVDNFNRYLLELKNLESQNNGVTVPPTDIQAVLGSEALHSILQNASSTDSLLAIAQHESTPATTAAGIFLLLSLGLSTWALLYHEAEQKHVQQQLAALVPQEKLNQTVPKPLLAPPHLYRLPDWVDPNGIHFHRYGMAVNGVWHDIADNSEVEKIFGRDNDIPSVDRGAYTIGWDPVHGGGTVGGDMPLRELWQMQSEVIHDGTLAQTPEQYARGESGTNHPLGWTFQPTQMYNPQDRTIYIVDQSSQGKFYDHLGWLAVSSDTPKNKISSLAFDTPTAFTEQTPWTQPFDQSLLLYQPNHVYQNLMPTDFQNYFQEQKQAGRSTESIYENNPFKKTFTFTPSPSQPTVTVATVRPPPVPTPSNPFTGLIPFRTGLSLVQQDSITKMLNNRMKENSVLNETDAKNYAYAIGQTNWQSYLNLTPASVVQNQTAQKVVQSLQNIVSPLKKNEPEKYNPSYLDLALVPNTTTISTALIITTEDPVINYFTDSAEQLLKGNFTTKVTALGTAGQIASGFLGIDLPADLRDVYYRLKHGEESKEHPVATALDLIGLLPVVGALKYTDEVGDLLKGGLKNIDQLTTLLKQVPIKYTPEVKRIKDELVSFSEVIDGAVRPRVDDVVLQKFINQMYRDIAKYGDGGTADVIRYFKDGGLSDPHNHITKALDSITHLKNKWLLNNSRLSGRDKHIINLLIEDLTEALN